MVLSHSRKAYSEVVYRQTTDNLKAAVIKADWYDPDLNPKLQSFCEHYSTILLPTKPRTPRHKGKVERGVGYVQDKGLEDLLFVGQGKTTASSFLRDFQSYFFQLLTSKFSKPSSLRACGQN